MDFIVGLPWTQRKFDAVWFITDRLTKSAHFIPMAVSYSLEWLAEIYIWEIVHLHGVPVSIISDRVISQASRWLLMRHYMVDAIDHRLGGLSLRRLGTDLVHDSLDKVKIIQDRLRTTQSKKKSYVNRKVRDVAFMVGERVLLRVLPMKGVMRFGKKCKLIPRFIRSFEILDRVGEMAYRLALPPGLSTVHLVFHVSMLRKCHDDPSHVLDFSTVQLDKDLTYEEELVSILDQ
ncbi:uncharacterized protein [Nicotiana sylvestris]|uniref:uncharacterized protein n=1 Tax=Nicotiana sylvestris TaxID=4096 RepID=UPI00388C353D